MLGLVIDLFSSLSRLPPCVCVNNRLSGMQSRNKIRRQLQRARQEMVVAWNGKVLDVEKD